MDERPAAEAAPPWTAVLDAIVQAAVDATDAGAASILAPGDGGLVALASAGRRDAEAGADPVPPGPAAERPAPGPAAYVLASGQPLALAPAEGRARHGAAVEASSGVATSVVCVPCPHGDAVLGVLEVVDKADGGGFSYEDLELATLLAGIAGAAMAVAGGIGAT